MIRRLFYVVSLLLTSMTAWAQVTYNTTKGTAGAPNEGSAELFDGKTSTKWCVTSPDPPTATQREG